jgi:hypothetical protein
MIVARRFASAVVLAAVVATSSGCAVIQGFLGGAAEPSVIGEEQSMLYTHAMREMMPDPVKDMKIVPSEKVWIVNRTGGGNTDKPIEALTYDALLDILRQRNISEVVARDDDMMRSLYVEYTESAKLAARADSLAREGKIQPADVMLTYRVTRINVKSPGTCILGVRFLVAGIMGLFTDAQPNITDGMRIAIHIETIDVKSGTVRASRIVEHVEPQPNWFAADYLFARTK